MRLGASASRVMTSGKTREALLALACFLLPLFLTPAMAHQDGTLVWTREPYFEGWGSVQLLDVARGQEGAIYYAVLGTHGIYRSSGRERSWVSVTEGLPAGSLGQVQVRALCVAPGNGELSHYEAPWRGLVHPASGVMPGRTAQLPVPGQPGSSDVLPASQVHPATAWFLRLGLPRHLW